METIRELDKSYARQYGEFLRKLDTESDYMLYKPGERKCNITDIEGHLRSVSSKENQVILARFVDERIIGYLGLFGGRQERISRVAELTCGVLKEFHGQGIATLLFSYAVCWSVKHGIYKIELTVEEDNYRAYCLYKKWGFYECGRWRNRIERSKGIFLDDVCMEYFIHG